jgi:hypothetical protein
MSIIEARLRRTIDAMELKTDFAAAIKPYADDPSYSLNGDAETGRHHFGDESRMMEAHESLMRANAKYRAAFEKYRHASDAGVAKLKKAEDRLPNEFKQSHPLETMVIASIMVMMTNARTFFQAHSATKEMVAIYQRSLDTPNTKYQHLNHT